MAGLHIMRGRKRLLPPAIAAALKDQRHEFFALLVADGMPLIEAFVRAGLAAKRTNSAAVLASNLHARPDLQARVQAIREARRGTAAVTLPEVTDMLQRVYAAGIADGELGPAHNAAFSLARLHGLVIDRAQIGIDVRRPTRDPDAPAEQALEGWLKALPGPTAGLEPSSPKPLITLENSPIEGPEPSSLASGLELSNDIKGLGLGWGRSENGAPVGPVTGTPSTGGRADPYTSGPDLTGSGPNSAAPHQSASRPPPPPRQGPPEKKRVPPPAKRVPGRKRGRPKGSKDTKPRRQSAKFAEKVPSFRDLFGE